MNAKTNISRLNIKNIKAAGGVVYHQKHPVTEVLMIHRRGIWDLPKGKVDQNETVEQAACREVEEETGCHGVRICFPLGTTTHSYCENEIKIFKKTWWFAMQSSHPLLKPQQEEQIDTLQWMNTDEAMKKVGFNNLKTVLQRFNRALAQHAGIR